MRFIALVAVLAVPAGVAIASPSNAPDPVPPEAKTDPCGGHRFSQETHARYAKAVFQRERISKSARNRLSRLARCQHTPAAKRNAKRLERKLKTERKERLAIEAITPYVCGFGRSAIPCGCVYSESGGNWHAHNPTSPARGLYQLLGHGEPWPVRTEADKLAHHRIARNLYLSSGLGPWVAPAC